MGHGAVSGKGAKAAYSPAEFTPLSEEKLYAVVDNPAFFQQDAELIYRTLLEQFQPIAFGNYLKRYLYRQAGLTAPFEQVPLAEYQDMIIESFVNHGVPCSFRPSTARIRQVSRNWLTQQTVSRDAVLLMGFGLRMRLRDVEELLTKGIQEPRLNRRDPRELLCAWCYEYGQGFHKFESLYNRYLAAQDMPLSAKRKDESGGRPPENEECLPRREEDLLIRAAQLRSDSGNGSVTKAEQWFERLYGQAQAITAEILNQISRDSARLRADDLADQLGRSDRMYHYQKQEKLLRARKTLQERKPQDITPAEIEQVLQSGTPMDRHGNLIPMKQSALYRQLRGRRLSRQRLEELLSKGTQVSRYDLMMLQFYIYSQREHDPELRLFYYRAFVEETNRMLDECGMGPLYTANPFECFLLMCILSGDPLGTYTDVMEQSYRGTEQ